MYNFEFEYTDENIFEHAISKIGAGELLHDNLTLDQVERLGALKDEYARIRNCHLHRIDGKQEYHTKTTTLRPHATAGEGWFHKPHDWHGPGTTNVKQYSTVDGTEIIMIDSDDGEITYKAHGTKEVVCIEDAPVALRDHIFREFCVQAAIICDCDECIIEALREHYQDLACKNQMHLLQSIIKCAAKEWAQRPAQLPGYPDQGNGNGGETPGQLPIYGQPGTPSQPIYGYPGAPSQPIYGYPGAPVHLPASPPWLTGLCNMVAQSAQQLPQAFAVAEQIKGLLGGMPK